jgi:hypothetical protein
MLLLACMMVIVGLKDLLSTHQSLLNHLRLQQEVFFNSVSVINPFLQPVNLHYTQHILNLRQMLELHKRMDLS